MTIRRSLLAAIITLASATTFAQQPAPAANAIAQAPQPWIYKTKQLNRTEIDKLLTNPAQVIVIDVRRPNELISKGGFPAYLSIQIKELENNLAYIPKDREIITVSNRAHRAGAAGDLLTSKGYKVAGAAGSLDYEDQGGKAIRISAQQPKAGQ